VQVPEIVRKQAWWVVLLLLFAVGGYLNKGMKNLFDLSKNLMFKSTSDIGDTWTHIIFEDDASTAMDHHYLFCLGVAVLLILGWWLVKHWFKSIWAKGVFTLLLSCYIAIQLMVYAYLYGVCTTVHDYPIVAFSEMSESDHGYVPFLLGKDDKMFAILLLKLDDKYHIQSRYIIYLPRTEVKWMTTVNFAALYRYSKIDDLQRLAEQVKNAGR
jgi:hypothetical protein